MEEFSLKLETKSEIAHLFSKFRLRSRLTHKQLAAQLGLKSDRMLRIWESGVSLPAAGRLRVLIEIYLALGLFSPGCEMAQAADLWQSVQKLATKEGSNNNNKAYPAFDMAWFKQTRFGNQSVNSGVSLHFERVLPIQDLVGPKEVRNPVNSNLPPKLTSFIGREAKLVELQELLLAKKLVTLTGTGGTGKTRLALEAASFLLEHFVDGIWLIELASLTRPQFIVETAAKVLKISSTSGSSIEDAVLAFLQPKAMLLILDNCEHLLAECARLTTHLLSRCPGLKIVATSREPLNVSGEWVVRVPSLDLPNNKQNGNLEAIKEYEAVRLFVERGKAAEPDFRLTEQNFGAVVQVCTCLDGIPLALELAAARLRGMGIHNLASRLTTTFAARFHLLTGENPTVQPRQQTLVALIEWSFNLLKEREQAVFRRLSVFPGDWTLEAAEAICAGDFQTFNSWGNIEPPEVTELVAQLVNKSLVQLDQTRGRYSMLETIRMFARQKLEETGSLSTLRHQHFQWFLKMAEAGITNVGSQTQLMWFSRLETEHDNFRSALGWTIERGQAEDASRLALALWQFWQTRIYQQEALGWLEQILGLASLESLPVEAQAKLYNAVGVVCNPLQLFDKAEVYQAQAMKLWEQVDDKAGIALTLLDQGWHNFNQVKIEQSLVYAKQSLSLARQLGEHKLIGSALILVVVDTLIVDPQEAVKPLLDECLKIWRAEGDLEHLKDVLVCYSQYEDKLGHRERAKTCLDEALSLQRQTGEHFGLIGILVNLMRLSLGSPRQPEGARQAARILGAIDSWERQYGDKEWTWSMTAGAENNLNVQNVIGMEIFLQEFKVGQKLTFTEIMELGQEITRPEKPVSSDTSANNSSNSNFQTTNLNKRGSSLAVSLTERETEILRLVSRGLSNQEIARQLVISHRTVEAHLRSIFAKIEVTSRGEAWRFAFEHGLS